MFKKESICLLIFLIIFFYLNFNLYNCKGNDVNEISNTNDLNETFKIYFNEWQSFKNKPEIMLSSNSMDYVNCNAYNKIISLGKKAIPLIIIEIEKGEFLLIYALEKITKLQIYDEKQAKLMSEQDKAALWLKWWENEKNNY